MDADRLEAFARDDYSHVVAAVGFACGDRSLAEDAVQEVLAGALDQGGAIDNLRGWVVRCALNRVRSSQRRRGAERRAVDRLRRVRTVSGVVGPDVGGEVLEALRSLPERQREITALHYLLDMSIADVADSLSVSEGTVKTQLHRARHSLRERLKPASAELTNDGESDHVT